MRNGSVNIDMLEEFVYLADSLSFRKTADQFYVSRSVISRHITALEESIGVRLLERSSRKVELTEAGCAFCQEAKAVLRAWSRALERARDAQLGSATVVRVGYLRNAARPVLVKFARYMAREHPEVRLSLECMGYADLRRAMDDHAVEVAIAMNVNPSISRNYRSTRIYEDEFCIVCAADHPLAALGRPLEVADLKGRKVLFPESFRDIGLAELAEELVGMDDLAAVQALYHDVDMLLLKMQTEGCVAFSSSLNRALFDEQVVMVPVADANTTFAVSAFYQDDFTGSPLRACAEGFSWCGENL